MTILIKYQNKVTASLLQFCPSSMAQPSSYPDPPVANPVQIIRPQFCCPDTVVLAIVRKVLTMTGGKFVVNDVNGNVRFKVKRPFLILRDRRALLDAAGNPIVTLRRKMMSVHSRWQVFRGDSTEASDLLFTAKRSSIFQLKTKLDVFLANNTKEDVCDFKVKGSRSERSCVVYAGESSTILAEMHRKRSVLPLGKDQFIVTVYPNVDYAFIVALIIILDAINMEGSEG